MTIGVSGYEPWLLFHFAQPDPLLSSWMSSPARRLQDFPV
jgi:hypothetical protein